MNIHPIVFNNLIDSTTGKLLTVSVPDYMTINDLTELKSLIHKHNLFDAVPRPVGAMPNPKKYRHLTLVVDNGEI